MHAAPPPDYTLVFYDDFTNTKVSNSLTYDGSVWYSNGQPCCMTPQETDGAKGTLYPSYPPGLDWGLPSPYTLLNPNGIELALRKQSSPNAGNPCSTPAVCWVGAQLSTAPADGHGHMWTYGYFATRIKLSAWSPGVWPSVSFYSYQPGYKPTFEIDLMEHVGSNTPLTAQTLHDYAATYIKTPMQNSSNVPIYFDGQWHTYSMLWTPQSITMYTDGVMTSEAATPIDANVPMFATITNGIGGGWSTNSTTNPWTMDVQYFAVWQLLP